MSVLCGRAAQGVRCCRGPAGGAAESRAGRGPAPGPAAPRPDHGGRFRPPRPFDSAVHRVEENRPKGPQLRQRGPRQSLEHNLGAPRPCGAWGPRCAAEALQRGSRRSQRPAARPAAPRIPALEGAVLRKCGSEAGTWVCAPGHCISTPGHTAPQSPRLVPHPKLAHAPIGPRGQRQIRVTRLASPLIKESRLRANKGHPNYVPFPDSFFLAYKHCPQT